jgi:hypothetical protein
MTSSTSLAIGALVTALTLLGGCTSSPPSASTDLAQDPSTSASSAASALTSASSKSPSAAPAPPSPSKSPSAAPATPSPSVGAQLGPDELGVVVATDGLRVRSLPTVDDPSEQLVPTLPAGVRFYVVDGPVTEDGYTWYQMQPYGREESLPFGWIAAGSRDGEPWIDQFPLGCDSVAHSAEGLVRGEPLEHLYCSLAGDSPRSSPPGPDIAFVGDVYCTAADDHWGFLSGPAWIDQRGYCELRTDLGSMRLQGAPLLDLLDGDANPVQDRYTLVGHFDDPAARECQLWPVEGVDPPDPAEVELWCRTLFVVTEVAPAS